MDNNDTFASCLLSVFLAFAHLVASYFQRNLHSTPGTATLLPEAGFDTSAVPPDSVPQEPEQQPQPEPRPTTTQPDPTAPPPTFEDILEELTDELTAASRDPRNSCCARLQRAFSAGQSAASKLSGATRRVTSTPSLATIQRGLSQPSPKWYVVLRGATTDIVSVHRCWSTTSSVVGAPIHNRSVFHSFHFRSEVEAYLFGAGKTSHLGLVPR